MFYPARMSNVLIGVHQRWLLEVTTALHKQGELEILDLRSVPVGDVTFQVPVIPKEDLEKILNIQFRIDRVLEILEPYAQKTGNLLTSIFSRQEQQYVPGYSGSHDGLFSDILSQLDRAEEVLKIQEDLKKNRDHYTSCEGYIASLERLKGTGIDLSYLKPAPFTHFIAGYVKEEHSSLPDKWLAETGTDEISLYSEKKDGVILIFCVSTSNHRDALSDLIHASWFNQLVFPESFSGLPDDMQKQELALLSEYATKEQKLQERLTDYAHTYLSLLQAYREELILRRERIDINRKFGTSRDVSYLRGWVRQRDEEKLKSLIRSVTGEECFVITEPADPHDDVPVRYDNPSWLAPFELLTTTFSRPRYDEIDPTPFFAPAYLLFFGMMLGDAGYGLIIALVGWLLYRGPGRNDASFRDMSYILLCSGVADIIRGTIQGGWFGDLLPRFFNIQPPFVLIEPLNSPILLFQIALIIGTIHLNLGIIIGLWENIRNRLYSAAIQENIIWFILQPSAAVLLIQFFGWTTFPSIITNLAIGGGLIGLAVLFLKKGPMGFFSLTGFLGDWLSYVRILALALATGGIAMTINILSEMIASVHPFMIVPAIIFCIAGQFFNLAIQTLGSVIHALRLHYIEFFGRFYSGGGREFIPFRENRIYTHVNNEDYS